MKNCWIAVVLFSLLATGVAAHGFAEKYSYKYRLETVYLTGIPNVANNYSVFAVKSHVNVDPLGSDGLLIQLTDVKTVTANDYVDQISSDTELDYRKTEEYKCLERGFVVKYDSRGSIESVYFNRSDDSRWCREFRIGVATNLLQINKPRFIEEASNQLRKDEEVASVVEVMEPTLTGECLSIYDFKARKLGSGEPVRLDVSRYRDFKTCSTKPYFVLSTHRRFKPADCDAEESHPFSRNAVCEYKIDLEHSDYVLKEAVCEGIVRYVPFGQDADSIDTTHNQTLILLSKQGTRHESRRSVDEFVSSRNLKKFNPTSDLFERLDRIRQPNNLSVPIIYRELLSDIGDSHHEQVRAVIKQAAVILARNASVDALKTILDKIVFITRILLSVHYDELKVLANEFSRPNIADESMDKEALAAKNLFWESVAITGSNPCMKLIFESLANRMITTKFASTLIAMSANHMANPTVLLADRMLLFCKSPEVQRDEILEATCYMSFGSLVARTCASRDYQVPMGPKMYCPEEKKREYIGALERVLAETDDEYKQMALLQAIGNTGLQKAFSVLRNFLRSREDIDDLVQLKAIYSLLPIARLYPSMVRESLIEVLFHKNENTEARIAAFDVLVASRPGNHLHEKIAILTGVDDDKVLGAYIYSTYRALANTSQPGLADLSSHAQHALSLMDDDELDTSAWMGATTIFEGLPNHVEAAAALRISSVGDSAALTPNLFYLALHHTISGYTTQVFSVSAYMKHASHLLNKILGPAAVLGDKSIEELLQGIDDVPENMGSDSQSIPEMLGHKTREQPKFFGVLFGKIMNFEQRAIRLDKKSIMKALSSSLHFARQSNRRFDLDIHRTMMPLDILMIVPTDAGCRLNIFTQTPTHLRLKVQLKINSPENNRKFDVDFRVKSHIAIRANVKVLLGLPLQNKMIGAGYQTTLVATPLVAGTAKLELGEQLLAVSYKPINYENDDLEVLHFSTVPYTLIEPYFQYKRLKEVARFIHVKQPQEYEVPLLGNAMVLKVKNELDWDDKATLINFLEENSLLGIGSFVLTQQWKQRKYELKWKVTNPPEIRFKVVWNHQQGYNDPENHMRNDWYRLWKQIFGWAIVPRDCQYQSESVNEPDSDEQDYSEESSESREYQSYQRIRPEKFSNEDYSSRDERPTGHRGQSYTKSYRKSRGDKLDVVSANLRQGENVLEINAELKVRDQSGRRNGKHDDDGFVSGYESRILLKNSRVNPTGSISVEVTPKGNAPFKKEVCFKGQFQDVRPPCLFGHHIPDMRNARRELNGTLEWGDSCRNQDGKLELKLLARKSSEQRRQKNTEKPWFYNQCKTDIADGDTMSDACMMKFDHVSLLNHLEAKLDYSKLPIPLYIFAEHVQNYLTYKFYPHLSHDAVARNKKDTIKAVVKFHDLRPLVDVIVERPSATLKFNKIYYEDQLPFFDAPSVAKSYLRRALEYYSDGDITPTCTVSDYKVNNFNNETFDINPEDTCEYLLSGDCTESKLFFVLLKNNTRGRNNDKTLTVHILGNIIEINPNLGEECRINGEAKKLSDNEIIYLKDERSGPELIAYVVKTKHLFKVYLPFNFMTVLFDGKEVKLITSHIFRQQLCGVCGERKNTEGDFVGPKSCRYTEGSDFANAYLIPSDQCRRPETVGERVCNSEFIARYHADSSSNCEYESPLIKKRADGQKTCISLDSYKGCRKGCYPEKTTLKTVDFHCASNSDSRIQALEKSLSVDDDSREETSRHLPPGGLYRPTFPGRPVRGEFFGSARPIVARHHPKGFLDSYSETLESIKRYFASKPVDLSTAEEIPESCSSKGSQTQRPASEEFDYYN